MAAAPSLPAIISVDEYFERGLENEWEYVDGELVPRRSGNPIHARLVMILAGLLEQHHARIASYAALVLYITETRFRVPDVCCYAKSVRLDPVNITTEPPLAIFEILSPTDPMSEVLKKCIEYRSVGVEHIFIIDPMNQHVLLHSNGGLPSLQGSISFGVGADTVTIELSALFPSWPSDSGFALHISSIYDPSFAPAGKLCCATRVRGARAEPAESALSHL